MFASGKNIFGNVTNMHCTCNTGSVRANTVHTYSGQHTAQQNGYVLFMLQTKS
jgi:hypothetical protein